jgi:hypothetical protein
MLNNSGVDADLRTELWAKCAATATKQSNLVSKKGGKSQFELFFDRESEIGKHSRLFG